MKPESKAAEGGDSVTWGEFKSAGVTFGDIKRAGITMGELADRAAFERVRKERDARHAREGVSSV